MFSSVPILYSFLSCLLFIDYCIHNIHNMIDTAGNLQHEENQIVDKNCYIQPQYYSQAFCEYELSHVSVAVCVLCCQSQSQSQAPGVASWPEFYISNVSICRSGASPASLAWTELSRLAVEWEGGRWDYFQHSSPVQSPGLPAFPLTPSQNVPTNTKLGTTFNTFEGRNCLSVDLCFPLSLVVIVG